MLTASTSAAPFRALSLVCKRRLQSLELREHPKVRTLSRNLNFTVNVATKPEVAKAAPDTAISIRRSEGKGFNFTVNVAPSAAANSAGGCGCFQYQWQFLQICRVFVLKTICAQTHCYVAIPKTATGIGL